MARLQAELARQNERIMVLEQENADLRRLMQDQQQVIIGIPLQNVRHHETKVASIPEKYVARPRPRQHDLQPCETLTV